MRALAELRSAGDIDGVGIGLNRAGELRRCSAASMSISC